MSLSNCEISRDPPHAQWGSKLGPPKSVAHVISWGQQLALNSSSLYLQHIQQTKTISLMCGYIVWNPWYNRVDEQARASYCWCSPVYITLFWLYACEIMLSFWIFNYGGTLQIVIVWYSIGTLKNPVLWGLLQCTHSFCTYTDIYHLHYITYKKCNMYIIVCICISWNCVISSYKVILT